MVTFCNKLFTSKFPYSNQISSQLLALRGVKSGKSILSMLQNRPTRVEIIMHACVVLIEIKATGRNFIFTFHVTIADIQSFTLTFFCYIYWYQKVGKAERLRLVD